MLVPRSYQYNPGSKSRSQSPKGRCQSPSTPSHSQHRDRRPQRRTDAMAPASEKEAAIPMKPKRISSISHAPPSEPVIIPTKTSTSKARRGPGRVEPKFESDDRHDPTALSPSMAALLAVTSEPRATARAIKGDHRKRLMGDGFRKSVSSTSPRSWTILQSPPSPTETDNEQEKDLDAEFDVGSMISQSTLADKLAMHRSFSSDSVPSLDIESEMYTLPESPPMPRTPSSRRARSPRRDKTKLLSTSEPLGCGEVHPLSLQQSAEEDQLDGITEEMSETTSQSDLDMTSDRQPSASSKVSSRFKSNLTASLQRLRTAAKSIAIPTPSMSSVLAINSRLITDSRPESQREPQRPKSPLPLNNSAFSVQTLSTIDRKLEYDGSLAQQLFFSSTPGEEYRPISSSVQLQEYTRRVPDDDPLLDRASAPPIFASSSPPPPIILPGVNSPRPREPRENSDFLRVIVLEMNMRRAGKLGDVAGRARIWIGPRSEKATTGTENSASKKSPSVFTRAEKGMSEEVATELAEAMMTKENIDLAEKLSSAGPQQQNEVPSRWTAWTVQ